MLTQGSVRGRGLSRFGGCFMFETRAVGLSSLHHIHCFSSERERGKREERRERESEERFVRMGGEVEEFGPFFGENMESNIILLHLTKKPKQYPSTQ